MSFATSQPIVNRFAGTGDIATAIRTHLLANVPNQKKDRMRNVSNAVAATSATVRIHPMRLNRIMRRNAVHAFVLDLVN